MSSTALHAEPMIHPVHARVLALLRPNAGWLAFLSAVALTIIGILAIKTGHPDYAAKQTKWLLIATVVFMLALLPPPRLLGALTFPMLAISLALLVLVVAPGVPRSLVPVRNGTTAWIDLKLMMFQPSEAAKVSFVLSLAWYLRYRENYRSLLGLMVPFVIMVIPVVLILKQPDLGTAMLFPPALFAMLIAAGAKLSHMSAIVGIALICVTLSIAAIFYLPDNMQLLKAHQRQRIVAMVSQLKGDARYNKDIGYQQHKAVTLIGSGGLSGYGETRSATILRFNKLPEDHNDMIFAVIVNRWGLLGGIGTLALYLLMFGSMTVAAGRSKDPFARLAIVGFTSILFAQMLINVGMSIGLLPIIGITLPFISYGGSSLLMTFAVMGLVISFASQRPNIITRPSFEYERRIPTTPRDVWAANK